MPIAAHAAIINAMRKAATAHSSSGIAGGRPRRPAITRFLPVRRYTSMTLLLRFDDTGGPCRASQSAALSQTLKTEPFPSVLVMSSRPRWRLRTCLTIARPRPVPPRIFDGIVEQVLEDLGQFIMVALNLRQIVRQIQVDVHPALGRAQFKRGGDVLDHRLYADARCRRDVLVEF